MKKHLFIITGRSGSGKSTALAAFEDAGFYCVDNMPVVLLPNFLELPFERRADIAGFAFVMDVREKGFLDNYRQIFDRVGKNGYRIEMIFLEADQDTLLRRYSQTRRQHPMGRGKSLIDGIRDEGTALADLRKAAHRVVNTSEYNVHQLKAVIAGIAQRSTVLPPMRIQVLSFGYKFGIPADADLVMDVRFLPNPYFIPALRDHDGESEPVRKYVLENSETQEFVQKYLDLLDYLLPLYEKEGKAYLTVAVGCTGGRHRSVVIAGKIFEHIQKPDRQVELIHRDID